MSDLIPKLKTTKNFKPQKTMNGKIRTHGFIDGTKNFFNFANLGLVLKINWSIKVRYFLIGELSHCIALASMKKRQNLYTYITKYSHSNIMNPYN